MSVEELPNYENAVRLAREARGIRTATGIGTRSKAGWKIESALEPHRASPQRPSGARRRAVLGLCVLLLAVFFFTRVHVNAHHASLVAAADVPAARTREVDDMRFVTLSLALTVSSMCMAGDNLVAGGDFETVPQGSAGGDCFSSLIPYIPGWSSNLGYRVDRVGNGPCEGLCLSINPTGGLYYISLQGSVCCGCNNNGWIEQAVPLTLGRQYRLRFDAQLDYSDQLRVSCGGQEWIYSGAKNVEWTTFTVEFTARSTNTLRFASESPTSFTPDGCGACWEAQNCGLDNISLVEIVCPGDVVANGIVDGADLAALLSVWGTDGGIYPRADTNGDGFVDAQDLAAVLSGWGACP